MAMNDFNIGFIGGLDGTKSKAKLNQDIDAIKKTLKELELKAKLDPNQVKSLENQLNSLKVNLNNVSIDKASLNNLVSQINNSLNGIKLQIPNLNTGNVGNQAQQVGQQIGNAISQGIANSTNGTSQATDKILRDFSELNEAKRQFVDGHGLISKDDIADANKFYQTVRETFKEFGQVTISKGEMTDGGLENLRVKIQQVNGELKTTREFMLYLNKSDQYEKQFKLVDDDTIKTTERMVQHLNEAKNITNATGDEANALKQKLAEQEKYYGNIKKEINTLYSLKTKLLSADELETAELEKQIKSIKQRITYNNQQIDKKGLRDNSLTREVNDLEVAKQKQLALAEARLQDSTNAKSQVQSQKELNAALKEQQSLSAQANKIQLSMGVTKLTTDYQKFGVVSQEVENNLKELKLAQEAVVNAKGTDRLASEIEKYNTKLAETKSSLKELTTTQVSMNQRTSQMTSMQEWMRKNKAATKLVGNEVNKLIEECKTCDAVRFNGIKNEFKDLQVQAGKAGKLGAGTLEGLIAQGKKFVQWIGVTGTVMRGIQIGKDMIQDVKDLDDSLLELSKVSDLSASGLEKVTEQAYELGEKVARTGREVIDATTEFKRAGFDMQQSMDMAESAMVMTNVAENITDTADAAGTLISVLKGFNMDASETMTIVDKINQVSNTSPIGFDNIAEGLERTAGTMAQSGNTIDQTIGLITAGYAQLRNVEKVSTGLITLSARLRGVDEEGETIDGLSAKLQEDFGKIGVAIENADGSLRSIYEIAQDYSKVLPTLSDKQKQYYAELAAGKRQVTVWNAITQQFQDAEYAVNQSINSQNSALDENQKKLDSIGGHVKSFESAMEHLSSTVVESDLIKFFVDLGTTGVKAIDGLVNALTPLGTIGLGAGLLASFKNAGRVKCYPSYHICL